MHPKTVLCVDDELNVLRALRRELSDGRCEVAVASSGREGLERLEQMEAAVVVSDHRMPGMTGAEFLGKVKNRWPDTFRIMLTAFADLCTVTAVVNEGEIHRFLSKPWNAAELRQAVRQGVERHSLTCKNRELMCKLEERNRDLQGLNETLEQRVGERGRQLEQAYRELVQSEKLSAVGRLAAGVIHEVMNPMTFVLGRIGMVMMDAHLPPNHHKSLRMAKEELQRAARTMNNLRDFSKQRPPDRVQTDVNNLASRALELAAHETKYAAVEVRTEFGSIPPVLADRDQLSQVFLNLVKNAVEAMPGGGLLTVATRVRKDNADGEAVEFEISDTGTGMPREVLNRIFEPFYTAKPDGTGLGLHICQGIVERHGGKIVVESMEGEGTSFFLRFPLNDGTD